MATSETESSLSELSDTINEETDETDESNSSWDEADCQPLQTMLDLESSTLKKKDEIENKAEEIEKDDVINDKVKKSDDKQEGAASVSQEKESEESEIKKDDEEKIPLAQDVLDDQFKDDEMGSKEINPEDFENKGTVPEERDVSGNENIEIKEDVIQDEKGSASKDKDEDIKNEKIKENEEVNIDNKRTFACSSQLPAEPSAACSWCLDTGNESGLDKKRRPNEKCLHCANN